MRLEVLSAKEPEHGRLEEVDDVGLFAGHFFDGGETAEGDVDGGVAACGLFERAMSPPKVNWSYAADATTPLTTHPREP